MFSRRPTPATGPVLGRPVHHVDAFVAVDVVDRRDDDDHAVEEGPEVAAREPAHQDLHGLFALDFAAVDVGEEEHHGPPRGALGWLAHGRIREGDERHRAALFGRTEALHPHER